MKKFLLVPALALVTAASAWASPLTGSQVRLEYRVGTISSSPYPTGGNGDYLVGAGVEVADVADGAATMDISDDRIVIRFRYTNAFGLGDSAGPFQFNGWVLSDVLGQVDAFSAVSVDTAGTTLADFSPVQLSFNANAITVNWKGLNFEEGQQLVLDLRTNPVPEPGGLPLMLAGLLGIALVRLKR
ncbi:PEP-CTERM sorting domain-containing protein [Azohydromonas lata]|uniref:PEP-CTERM sorting domain-containing protein n=1 Tax=Azohydromonas lata TaxID=45677 RepID=A0ABU5IDH9_9BURK|nr:PEP-CTERM sorting domain-containing protein [Azohydromonas lata]MDZ5457171.1 PEP-CTERM sorting domain-containing protein [Azohydromonas lata]